MNSNDDDDDDADDNNNNNKQQQVNDRRKMKSRKSSSQCSYSSDFPKSSNRLAAMSCDFLCRLRQSTAYCILDRKEHYIFVIKFKTAIFNQKRNSPFVYENMNNSLLQQPIKFPIDQVLQSTKTNGRNQCDQMME